MIRSGIYSIGSRFSVLLFGFGSFYFLIRTFPKEQFGVWSFFLTVTTIIEMSRNGLVQNALIKLLHSSDEEDSAKVISASWIINLIYSLVIYLILVVGVTPLSISLVMPDLQQMFFFYGITLIILIPLSQFNYLEQSKLSFKGIFWSAFFRQGFFFVGVIFIFYFKLNVSLVELVIYQSACALVGVCVAYLMATQVINFTFSMDWIVLKRAFHFGKYVMGTNILSLFFKNIDQFSIGYFLNASGVALYSSAMRLSNLIEYPATSVAEVIYPHSTSKVREEGESVMKTIYEKSVGLTLAITTPFVVFTFLFSDFIIYVIAGIGYAESAGILRVVILFGLLIPFNRQFGMAMDATGRPQLNFLVLVLALCVNIILNILFIRYLGLIGAAYATLLSYCIIGLVSYVILRRIFGVSLLRVVGFILFYYSVSFQYVRNIIRQEISIK